MSEGVAIDSGWQAARCPDTGKPRLELVPSTLPPMTLRPLAALLVLLAGCASSHKPAPVPVKAAAPPSTKVAAATPPAETATPATAPKDKPYALQDHYTKQHHLIPMRDGVKLYTEILQ